MRTIIEEKPPTIGVKVDSLKEAIQQSRTETINEMCECLETASKNLSDKICESCQKNIRYTDTQIRLTNDKKFSEVRNLER